jgi:hypothetical protein
MSNNSTQQITAAEQMWNEIKDREVQMFSLPGQTVAHYCTPTPIDPSKLFLTYTVSSCIPAVEAAIIKDFDFEIAKNFIIITRKV